MGLFDYSKVMPLASKALDYRSLRADLINSNIANVDTPFYRPKDIRFENALAKETQELFNIPTKKLKLANTNSKHLQPSSNLDNKGTIFIRDGHLARNDGNSVDIDIETSEMGKNTVMYNALINGITRHRSVMKSVLEASRQLQ
jgi:flagellar basal-body rod protein FlgB